MADESGCRDPQHERNATIIRVIRRGRGGPGKVARTDEYGMADRGAAC